MELKFQKGLSETELEVLAKEALEQIEHKRYELEFQGEVKNIMKLGIAFSGKKVRIRTINVM